MNSLRRQFHRVRMANIDLNPPVNRSMRELDRSFFKKTIPVLAAQVDSRRTGELLRASALRRNVLDIPKITNVIRTSDNDDGKRLILLDVADVGTKWFCFSSGCIILTQKRSITCRGERLFECTRSTAQAILGGIRLRLLVSGPNFEGNTSSGTW